MRIVVVLLALLFVVSCSRTPAEVPSQDGAYVALAQDGKASLVVIQGAKRTEVDGTYENETGVPPSVGNLAPGSVSGAFNIKTATCGDFEFVLGKGNMLVCTNCSIQRSGPGGECKIPGVFPPQLWTAVYL